MNSIKQWFESHKISAHTLVAAWGVADVLWYTNTEFHAYVSGILVSLPAWLHGIVFGLIVPLILYWKTTKGTSNPPKE